MFHVIDDNEDVCELVVELLVSAGHEANSYLGSLEYLNYMNSDNYTLPAAAITDVRMPGISGYDLINRVREKFPELKFVVMSGYNESHETLRKAPCHFLAKPFSVNQLIAIADAIVRCDREGDPAVNSMCTSSIEKSNLNVWACPLDCTECGTPG